MDYDFLLAGHGGQGVLYAGMVLAEAAFNEGKEVVWFPSYGGEVRGGFSNCLVITSDRRIASPYRDLVRTLACLNALSLERFQSRVNEGGTLIYNSSVAEGVKIREDLVCYPMPLQDIIKEPALASSANMVILGALIVITQLFNFATVEAVLRKNTKKGRESLTINNIKAMQTGYDYVCTKFFCSKS